MLWTSPAEKKLRRAGKSGAGLMSARLERKF